MALESLDAKRGSKVVVPEFTMIACARAVTMAGLQPVFVDCGEDLLIDCDKIEEQIMSDTVAVMPVHVYGRRCDMDRISKISAKYGLSVIEDMAEAHGIPVHQDSYAACYSFYKNKIIYGEEGGAVSFRPGTWIADSARSLRSLGFTDKHDFFHRPGGMNARMSDVHASLVLMSLSNYQEAAERRFNVSSWYDAHIDQAWKVSHQRFANWVYDLRIPGLDSTEQDRIVKTLNDGGVAARHGFKPMSMQAEYASGVRPYYDLVAYQMSREVVYLPVSPLMTESGVVSNCVALRCAVEEALGGS